MMKNINQQLGVTLLELIVTVGIVAMVATMGITGFSTLRDETRMRNLVNHLVHSIHLARQAARAADSDIVICKSADGATCSNSADWHDGWLIFGNANGDIPVHRDAGEKLYGIQYPVTSHTIFANRNAFIIRPPRKRSTNGTITLCDRRGADSARAIILSYTGKPRISTQQANGSALRCGGNA